MTRHTPTPGDLPVRAGDSGVAENHRRTGLAGRWSAHHTLVDERGDTLIELLVTVVIMGIAVVAIVGAIANSITLSGVHRKQAVAGAYVRAYAEAVEAAVAASPSAYTPCAGPSAYASVYTVGAPYTASITDVTYWDGTNFVATCGTDSGIQRVALKVATTDGKVTEKLAIIIRKPCRSTTDFPSDTACAT